MKRRWILARKRPRHSNGCMDLFSQVPDSRFFGDPSFSNRQSRQSKIVLCILSALKTIGNPAIENPFMYPRLANPTRGVPLRESRPAPGNQAIKNPSATIGRANLGRRLGGTRTCACLEAGAGS